MDIQTPRELPISIPPLVRGLLIGLIIGLAIGLALPWGKKSDQGAYQQGTLQQAPQQTTPIAQPNAPPPVPPAAPQGVYAKVQKNDNGTLTAQELKSDGTLSGKIFNIKAADDATITYQKPNKDAGEGKPAFTAQTGKIGDIKIDMYLFILTTDNPETSASLNANQIMYSEKNPF